MTDKIIIFDTTLRDGEQSPGASMTLEEKLQIALSLENMKVDVIEAGFPAASKGDFESVSQIAKKIKNSTICALSRAHENDINLAGKALRYANKSRIHTFIATSKIHMETKLKMNKNEVLEKAVKAIILAKKYTNDIEFSAEDAFRSDPKFLCEIFEAVINAGATTINIPDTVGYSTPSEVFELISYLIKNIKNSNKAIFSVHCHNDLGMAVANSLSAIRAGANQVECTINGIGERAGNASLEEIVMSLKTRHDLFNCETNINTKNLVPLSKLVSNITGMHVQANKAIVGLNAFAHEAGIHQDGILKNRETYEIMKATDVGWKENRMVLGKHSGRAALKTKFNKLGITFETDLIFDNIFKEFKNLADNKHEIFDDDLLSLYSHQRTKKENNKFEFINITTTTNYKKKIHKATISLTVNGNLITHDGEGNGTIDAIFDSIKKATNTYYKMDLYSVKSVTPGTDAQGEIHVRLSGKNITINGNDIDVDTIVASAKAYIDALNKIEQISSLKYQSI